MSRLFRKQHGVAASRQIRAAGISWGREERMVSARRWLRVAPGVVAVAGAPHTWHQRAMAATLSVPGLALLSGPAAARLHGLDGFADVHEVEITLPIHTNDRTAAGVTVRWCRRLSLRDRHIVHGIPVTIQPVTLIHLAAREMRTEQALDAVLRQGRSPRWLREHFQRWQGHGVTGPSALLTMLDERMGKRLPLSWFQRLAAEVLRRHGVHMVDEHEIVQEGRVVASLDLADPQRRIGVECQSIEYHETAADRARDVRRLRLLRRLGWEVIELWWSDLDRMDDVLAAIAAAIERAAAIEGAGGPGRIGR